MKIEILETLTPVTEESPRLNGRLTLQDAESGISPFRAYFHESMFRGGFNLFSKEAREEAKGHLIRAIAACEHLKDASFLLAVCWQRDRYKITDILRPKIKQWALEPEYRAFRFEDGIYQPEAGGVMLGDGLRILGREEEYRRHTRSMAQFLKQPPQLDGFSIRELYSIVK